VGLDTLSVITNVNPKFVLEHQMAVVNCLTDSDESLRKKTLDLMFAMCKTHNVEIIVAKMVAFLVSISHLPHSAD
jgi:AP-4 complex subunit epsilon-1